MSAPDTGRGLSPGAFAALLSRLGPNAEQAGAAYEHLRRALVSFFAWRGAATPEECADETLDRLARRLDEGVPVDDLSRFARGIARLVLLEHWRRSEARSVPFEDLGSALPPASETPDEAVPGCLERCLGDLPAGGRDLVLRYYAADSGRDRIDGRKRMARALGVTESALRNRAQRLRDRLERCILSCLGGDTQ